MATKTVSLDLDAYERLKEAKSNEKESFSQVIKRAVWPPKEGTAGSLLEFVRTSSRSSLSKKELDQLDASQASDTAPSDRWAE